MLKEGQRNLSKIVEGEEGRQRFSHKKIKNKKEKRQGRRIEKRRGRYGLKRGRGNNNRPYTPSEASDCKEGATSRADWALA